MKRILALVAACLGLSLLPSAPALAQQGFALKGDYIVNASSAKAARESGDVPHADGLGIGLEYVLPLGIGLGVSGYTADQTSDLDYKTTELTVLAEANYFLRLPIIPVSPYVGVHAGLGHLSRDNVSDPQFKLQDRTRSQLGYQVGVRVQLTRMIGLDAQWRRMSTSAAEGQDGRLERDQVVLGVALF
jgi:opacity protein-like surface antigen